MTQKMKLTHFVDSPSKSIPFSLPQYFFFPFHFIPVLFLMYKQYILYLFMISTAKKQQQINNRNLGTANWKL